MTNEHHRMLRSGVHQLGRHRARAGLRILGLAAALVVPGSIAGCAAESDDISDEIRTQGSAAPAGTPRDANRTLEANHADPHGDSDAPLAQVVGTAAHDADHAPAAHAAQMHNQCRGPAAPDPRDAQITTGDAAVLLQTRSGQDVTLPPQVLDWMKETQFAEAHDGWHLVRRWDQGCRKSNAPAEGCSAAQRLLNQGLWRADVQQGAPGDGLAFMMAHRHMLHMMKETFPKHAGLFSSFKRIPKTKNDPENPMPWKNISWTSNNLKGF